MSLPQEKQKECTKCNKISPLSGFSANHTTTDKLSSQCKKCASERSKEWRLKNKDKHRQYSKEWQKLNPEKRKKQCRKYTQKHREKLCEKRRERYQRNKDKERENSKKWQLANLQKFRHAQNLCKTRRRHQMKKSDDKITFDQWENIKTLAGNRCHYCKKEFKKLTMDHVIPLSRGGEHNPSNIVPACQSCNASKSNKIITLL